MTREEKEVAWERINDQRRDDEMTEDLLKEIEARASSATPGKWEVECIRSDRADLLIDGTRVASTCSSAECGFDRVEDMGFIVAAREDIPALIAEVRRLTTGPK